MKKPNTSISWLCSDDHSSALIFQYFNKRYSLIMKAKSTQRTFSVLATILLVCLGCMFHTVFAQAPNLLLKATSATSADNSTALGTAVDASGNTYVTGYFEGSVTFGSTTLVSAGEDDIFLVKYNIAGVLQWAKRAGGVNFDVATGVAVSGSDVYITGNFRGTANFNTPSATGSNEITSAGNSEDIFLAKYNSAGDFQWAKHAGGTGSGDAAAGVAVSGSDVYITGRFFNGTANFNTPSAPDNQITSAGGYDIFLAKYNSAGAFQWAKRAGGTNNDVTTGIAVSGSDVYITGSFTGTANFNTPSAPDNQITSAGFEDIFLAKFDNTGAFQWVKRAGGTADNDQANGVAVSGSDVYITGGFGGTANFNTPSAPGSNEITSAGNKDIFLAKYDNTGALQWAKRAGGISTDQAYGVAVSGSEVYITGRFGGTANFINPLTGSNEITSAGDSDIFLAKYDNTGASQWAKRAGGTGFEQAHGVAVSGSEVYIIGSFRGTVNFNTPSTTGSNELTTVATGGDAFLARYNIFCAAFTSPLYVDASNTSGTQNGTSWATAYTKLQDAIDAATTFGCGVEIRVAAGTYLPTKDMTGNASPSDNRTKTFYIKKDGMKIYGGYPAGGGTRNVATNLTILSGDFSADDMVSGSGSTLSFSNNTENAYHVVYIDGTTSNGNITAATLLDGFRISGGNANGVSSPNNLGGGVFNNGQGTGKVCSPTFANCTLSSNSASSGGGMYNSGNSDGTSSPSLTNCTLNGNLASGSGGGMVNDGRIGTSNPSLTNCTLNGNKAGSLGGGMFNITLVGGISSPSLSNCTLNGNSATNGGGMYNYGDAGTSSPSLTNCTLAENSATTNGGGMYNNGSLATSSPILTNCRLSGNSAGGSGGGMYNLGYSDGGISSPSLTNCTLSGNSATNGGGMYNTSVSGGTSSPSLSNCILWSNGSNQIVNNNATGTTINYSIYDDGTPNGTLTLPIGVTNGGNNLDSNPLFTDAANGNYTLTSCSPAINAGNNAAIPSGITTDLAGNPRRYNNGTVDMGAHELQANQNIPTLTVGTIPSICSGATSFTIPYTATTGTPTTYTISGTGITTVTDGTLPSGSITVNLSAAASGTSIPFTLTVKNVSGCASAEITGSVTVNATTTPSVSISPMAICAGTSTTLSATATNGGSSPQFYWSKNNEAQGISDFSNKTTADGLGANGVRDVYVDKAGKIYAATSGGLSISTNGGTSFTNKTTTNGLGANFVLGVYVDNAGTIYAATNGGLSISTNGGTSFSNKTNADGLWAIVNDAYVDNAGTIYAATDAGLSISTNGGTSFTNKTTTSGLGANIVYDAYVDNAGTIYAATDGGLSISTNGGTSFTNKTTASGLGANNVFGVYVDNAGTIYAATSGGLSISTNGGTSFTNKTTTNGLGANSVSGVYVDNAGTIYAATFSATNGGVSISSNGGMSFVNKSNGLLDKRLYAVYVGTDGTIYAAVYGSPTVGGLSIASQATGNTLAVTSAVAGDVYKVTLVPSADACPSPATAMASVTVNALPTATISYAGSPFCKSATTGAVTITGTTGGTFSSTAGLTINATTGEINPSTSTAGTYTVTYTIPTVGGCAPAIPTAMASVTITANPTATISYAGSPFCKSATTGAVTITGATSGTFSSTAGLTIDANTGAINPSTSTTGTYTVTYNITASGGCAVVNATTSVTIQALATATETMTWTGTVSTDWNNACNWSPNGVPTATNAVLIPDVANDPIVPTSLAAVAKSITFQEGAQLTVQSGATLTVTNEVVITVNATMTNSGTVTAEFAVNAPSPLIFIKFTFVNESTGIVNGRFWTSSDQTSNIELTNRGTINYSGSAFAIDIEWHSVLNNYGIINITGGKGFDMDNSNSSFTNHACGKILLSAGTLRLDRFSDNKTNFGLIQVAGEIKDVKRLINNGVIKYGTLSGDLFDNSSGIIVHDTVPIFTYGSASQDTVKGIFIDADATLSAGTFTAPNTFMPLASLPAGSQTLYAKITPSGGTCSFVVPFNYTPRPFITTWNLTTAGSGATQLTFGVATSGNVNYTWTTVPAGTSGSGTFSGTTATITGLPAGATIELSIEPANFQRFIMNNGTDKSRLIDIKQWGDVAWTSMNSAFWGCNNMTMSATDVPNTALVTDMNSMFRGCSAYNHALPAGFNTANVTNMNSMFQGCSAYNQALPAGFNTANVTNMISMFQGCNAYNKALPAGFNTANVTDMRFMFQGCSAYNHALPAGFNTAKVTNMNSMFFGCSAYNQALPAGFNTSNVTNMYSMFFGCSAYNQALPAGFNTSKVTDMSYMFDGCRAYNQALPASFNTAMVTNMTAMFNGCSAYNQALPASFNTANVTEMNSMFQGCNAYNQALPAAFNTAMVTDMVEMFDSCIVFNQVLPVGFNTAKVTGMFAMFRDCRAYNQALPAGFTTAMVTNMNQMFSGATAFNQNIGNLNISNAFVFDLFKNSGIDQPNYDAILTAWNAAGYTNKNLNDASPLKYCTAAADRANLVKPIAEGGKGWTITGDASGAPTLTVGTIPAICSGATSFTIPYTATTGTPTTYSISGTGITTVTDGTLPNGSITVSLSAAASGTSIPFTLTVKNASGCASAEITGSVTVNATTLYVDASNLFGREDGTSWATAYTKLQDAIDAATTFGCGVDIYVAAGTYLPTKDMTGNASPSDNRTKTFYIKKDGIKIYGGYPAGGGTRNVATNVTILSGDFNANDVVSGSGSTLSFTNNTENAYHVVHIDGTTSNGNITAATLLDGFRISGGNANGASFPNNVGGGVFNDGQGTGKVCSPTFANCTLSSNSASSGGGMCNLGLSGGTSSPSLTNCTLNGNKAGTFGGGMFNNGNNGTSSPSLTNCTLSGNSASNGGGMYNSANGGTSSPSLTNCTLSGNSATSGGGMYNYANVGTSSPSMTNCTLSGNSATFQGGGMYNDGTSSGTSSPSLSNCILWSNGSNPIFNNNTTGTTINYSIYDDGTPNGTLTLPTGVTGNNNLDSNPLFTDAANGNYTLTSCSPAINAGSNAAIPSGITTDLAGNPRRYNNGTVDMGAYELQANQNLPTLTVGTIPAICSGATSFTIPYTATTGTPTTYSISGTGITTVTDGTLPSGSISVSLSAAASGTSIPFTLTVKNASGCISANIAGSVTVNAAPTATISYAGSPFCKSATTGAVTITGATGGTFSSTAGLTIDATTGEINPSTSTAGTYTVTYAIAASGGCASVNATASVTISNTATATQLMRWTGTVSTDWNDACNWSPNGVPTATNPVNIDDVANDPVIMSGTVANCSGMSLASTLTINNGGELNVLATSGIGIQMDANSTLTNNGTLNASISASGSLIRLNGDNATFNNSGTANFNTPVRSIVLNSTNVKVNNTATGIMNFQGGKGIDVTGSTASTITNQGTMNYTATDFFAALKPGTTFNNSGTIDIRSGSGIAVQGGTLNNLACAKILMPGRAYDNQSNSVTTNAGLIITQSINNTGGSFTNNGVLKYSSSLSGNAIINNQNSSVIVNNTQPIFTYGGTFDGTINGIFKDAAATISAGTFTAPNTFAPSGLVCGTNALYAQITPMGGACTYIVPFTYTPVPPTVSITGATTICIGSTTTLSPTTGGTWTSSSDTRATVTNAGVVTGVSNGAVIFSFTQMGTGCIRTTPLVTVNPTTTPSVSISPTEICAGTSPTLTATAMNGGSSPQFTWTKNNASVGTGSSLPVSNAVAGDVYKVTLVPSADACPSVAMAMASVTVNNCVNIIYVNAANTNPTQNGNAWATAFSQLTDGLAAAAAVTGVPVEVWVANGTYKPGNTRQSYFNIPSGVKVYGGFGGTETLLSQRPVPSGAGGSPTQGQGAFLSGEIGSAAMSDNTHHVVVFNATNADTQLDGFTITRGFANFVPSAQNLNTPDLIASGGGILAVAKAQGQVKNCTITDNKAIFGGGIFQQDTSQVQVINTTVWGNEATFGGGVYHLQKSTPSYTNCLIVQNKAGIGGAIYNNNAHPSLMNCTIAANDGSTIGGIYNTKSSPTVVNSILWGNSTPQSDVSSVITYSVVEGSFTGTGNLGSDPKLVNAVPFNLALTSPLGDYRLLACSPALNAGTATGAPPADLAGNARPQGAGIDMGAYEGSGVVMPSSLNITTNITTGTVTQVAGQITATNQISNANVTYTAGSSVTLLPGFEATGNVFKAQIGTGCN